MTAPIKPRNIGHFRTIVIRMSGVMLRATRQPTKPCATTKAQAGILTRPSNHEIRIAAAIAPSSRAAGRRISSKAAMQMSERVEKRAPLQGRRLAAQREMRTFRPQRGESEGVAVRYARYPGKDSPHRIFVGFNRMLVVASLTITSS